MQSFFPRPSERALALTLGFILFVNYLAMGVTKVVAVSGFLGQVRDHYILLVWIVDMILLIIASSAQSYFIDRINRVRLLKIVLVAFSLLYLLLGLTFLWKAFPLTLSYTLIYLLNDQQWRFFPVLFWILANDVYPPAQGKRLIPFIGNFAFLGTLTGLGIATLDAYIHVGAMRLLLLNASFFFLAFLFARKRLDALNIPTSASKTPTLAETFKDSLEFIRTVPTFGYLTLGMLFTGIIMSILLYESIYSARSTLGGDFQAFYAQYNLAIVLASLGMQFFSVRLVERMETRKGFLIQPVTMIAGVALSLFFPHFLAIALGHGIARVTYETVDLSFRKAVQSIVPNEKRGRVSMFIDSYLPSLGTIVGSLIAFVIITIGLEIGWERLLASRIYLGFAMLIGFGGLWTGLKVYRSYADSLLNWKLKRRSRAADLLSDIDFSERTKE